MSSPLIIFAILSLMVVLFASNLVPIAIVALGAALLLYATGILEMRQALAGFGDPTVLFISSLFVVSASLEASGVTAGVGRILLRRAGASRTRLLVLTMLLVALLTAMIGVGGAVVALLPMVILSAIRLGRSPSQLLMPLAFAAHAGSMLVLTGSLVNVLISDAKRDAGLPAMGFFDVTIIGVPLLAGTIAIVVLFGERLLPARTGRAIPADLSRHSGMLAEQYQLFENLHRFTVGPDSALLGARIGALEQANHAGLSLLAVEAADDSRTRRGGCFAAGDVLLLRGDAAALDAFAAGNRLIRRDAVAGAVGEALFNTTHGFAEVVIPPRSGLIGEAMFPGMITPSGELIVLAIQRRGENLGPGEVRMAAGDTLLLQGSWAKLDQHLSDPDVLVVNEPDSVRRQAVPFGTGSRRALAILACMVATLASGAVPTVIAGLTAAFAIIVLRVLTLEEAYRAINWSALIMIASLIPMATAMEQTGAADLLAHGIVTVVGDASPHALLAALFAVTAILCQLISSTATALIIIPIAFAAASECGVAPRTALVTVAVGAAACFLSPVASSANLIVQGPGGYRFGDYWKLGLPLLLWFFLVGTFLVPVFWPL